MSETNRIEYKRELSEGLEKEAVALNWENNGSGNKPKKIENEQQNFT
ncbi:hypothetical protein [Gramella sp. AN32]|uniref:Uncharacterized protein n=1 Tax=Christiangramia antarctica TaxID=2058158 RepID=A0ABW5X837_9FLAO|nr:hypothetical protein [Gramella sp. AN32]